MRASVVVAVLVLTVASNHALAQVRVGRDSSTRLNRFGRDLVYGTAMGLAYAGVDQARNEPPEWGVGWEGYRRRAASNVGEFIIQEGTTSALAAAMHRPLDYTRCPCRDFARRIGWALWGSVTDQLPNGRHPIAVPRIVGAYAGSFAQATWRPSRSNRVHVALLNGTLSLLIGAGINVFQELKR